MRQATAAAAGWAAEAVEAAAAGWCLTLQI